MNNEAGTCQSLYWNILLTSCSVSAVLSRFPCRLGFWRVLASSPLETLLSLFWGSGRDLDIRLLVALSLQQSPANSSFDCAKLGLCLLQRIGPHKQSVEIALGLGGSKCIRPGTKGRPRRKPQTPGPRHCEDGFVLNEDSTNPCAGTTYTSSSKLSTFTLLTHDSYTIQKSSAIANFCPLIFFHSTLMRSQKVDNPQLSGARCSRLRAACRTSQPALASSVQALYLVGMKLGMDLGS